MLSRADRLLAELLDRKGELSPEGPEHSVDTGSESPDCSACTEVLSQLGEPAQVVDKSTAPTPLPRSLGEYEILRRIGIGGTAAVYEAVQTGLARTVALKIIAPSGVSSGVERERLVREAKATARLRHPNVVQIIAAGEASGVAYIAMEFLTGGSLEDAVALGPADPDWAAKIIAKVASALDAAHQAGLVHRDIKPSNILLAGDGSPKLSDFGLVHDRHAARLTVAASVLGTPSYMSPEQARGEAPDPSHDVYSLGAVLYALIAGRPPFDGEIASAVLADVLVGPPAPLEALVPAVPRGLAAIVNRAMARRAEDRYASAADFAEDLGKFIEGYPTQAVAVLGAARRRKLGARGALAGMLLLIAFASWEVIDRLAGAEPKVLGIGTPLLRRVTSTPGLEISPTLSPDGRELAYCSEADGDWDIYIRRLSDGSAVNITEDCRSIDSQPAFSPSGTAIAFRSECNGGGVFVVDLRSRVTRKIAEFGYHPTWAPAGDEIAVSTESVSGVGRAPRNLTSEIWAIDVRSGTRRRVVGADAVQPAWSPSGTRIAFWGHRDGRTSLWTIGSDGSAMKACEGGGDSPRDPTWLADGSAIVTTSRQNGTSDIWLIPVAEATGRCGKEETVLAQSAVETHQSPTAARGGRWLAVVNWVRRESAIRIRGGSAGHGSAEGLTSDTRVATAVDLHPDGSSLVACIQDGPSDLVILQVEEDSRFSLTEDLFEERTPRWSPSGRWIAFAANRSGNFEIWRMRPDGTGAERLTITQGGSALSPVWSPDGRRLAYGVRGKGILEIDPSSAGPRVPRVLRASEALSDAEAVPRAWSPDGRYLLLIGKERTASVLDLDSGQERVLPLRAQGGTWTPAGELWVTAGSDLKAINPETGETRVLFSVAPKKFSAALSIDPRTGDAYTTVVENEADIWLMDLASDGGAAAASVKGR